MLLTQYGSSKSSSDEKSVFIYCNHAALLVDASVFCFYGRRRDFSIVQSKVRAMPELSLCNHPVACIVRHWPAILIIGPKQASVWMKGIVLANTANNCILIREEL